MIRCDILPIMALLAAPMLAAQGASAQATCPAGRVAFIQGTAILASIPRYVARRDSDLAFGVNAYKVEISVQQAVLDSLTGAFQEKSALLPPSTRRLEFNKLQNQKAQIERRTRELQQQFGQERQRLFQPIEMGVQAMLDSTRIDLKCAIIFDVTASSALASANKALDLTQRIIDRIRTSGDTSVFGPPDTLRRRP